VNGRTEHGHDSRGRGPPRATAGTNVRAEAGDAYSGPRYVYAGGLLSRPEARTLEVGDRTGPINVAWHVDALPEALAPGAGREAHENAASETGDREVGRRALAWVAETMEGPGGWTSIVPNWWARQRYVRVDGPDGTVQVRPAAAEVQRRLGRLDPFRQYHVRLYDVADVDRRYPVVGQAHWDPTTHDWPIPFTDSPGRFVESRRAVLETWQALGYGTATTAAPPFADDDADHGVDWFDGVLGVVTGRQRTERRADSATHD
jgi:hypothetical protein